MPEAIVSLPDPRVFADIETAPEPARSLYTLAASAVRCDDPREAEAMDRDLRAALVLQLGGEGRTLARILAGAPSTDVARHLWRALDGAWRDAAHVDRSALDVTMFALPLVIVAGRDGGGNSGVLPGIVADPAKLAAILRDHGALSGNHTFALSNALVALDAIDVARLPEIVAWCRLPDTLAAPAPVAFAPAPLEFPAAREAVHLRFLPGVAVAKPGADLTADPSTGKWGIPFVRELIAQMTVGDASVLALPRAARRLLPAVADGRAAQREVAAQIFASNAIRKFRASVGEPSAVISAHRVAEVPGGGEFRLSLSSPLEPRDAEGFRCPLYPLDRAGDVVAMLLALLQDCRVTDIRTLAGVHADRADETGPLLLFKPESIPDAARFHVH